MAGLPKKYAKMGFSAGWKAYKRNKGGAGMARSRRKAKYMRFSSRPGGRSVRRSRGGFRRRSSSSGGMSGIMPYLAAAGYGAARVKLTEWMTPISSKIPMGEISDELAMFGAAWLVNKYAGGKVPIIGQVARAGMLIEAAAIGQAIANGSILSGSTGGGNGNGYVIG